MIWGFFCLSGWGLFGLFVVFVLVWFFVTMTGIYKVSVAYTPFTYLFLKT